MDNNIVNSEFKVWVSEISKNYRQAQIKAAINVNSEMLKFYFELGKKLQTIHSKPNMVQNFMIR